MPYRYLAEAILADSSAVARDLQAIPEDTREAADLRAEADALRAEYRRLVENAFTSPRRPPTPLPSVTGAESI